MQGNQNSSGLSHSSLISPPLFHPPTAYGLQQFTLPIVGTPSLDPIHAISLTGKRPMSPVVEEIDTKRVKHKKIEQKRRNGIKLKMDELRGMVPRCSQQDTQAVVLEKTADYIQLLKEQYSDISARAAAMEAEYKKLGGNKQFADFPIEQDTSFVHNKTEPKPKHCDTN